MELVPAFSGDYNARALQSQPKHVNSRSVISQTRWVDYYSFLLKASDSL